MYFDLPRMFEYRRPDGSGKFWEVRVEGSAVVVRFGKLKAKGQANTKPFRSPGMADLHRQTKIREKLTKGYKEIYTYCKNCCLIKEEHAGDKCLFEPTRYEVWKP